MAVIKSGASTDEMSVDSISKAARVTLYNTDGTINYANDFGFGIASGIINARPIKIIGKNPDVDNAREDMWELGGTYVFPTAGGIQMQIVSSSANDAAGSTGIRQIELHYIEATTFLEKDEILTMNGVTPVNTVATNIYRINGIHAIQVGSNGTAVGNISLQSVGGATTYSRITAGLNTHLQAIYTVPSGYNAYITGWAVGTGSTAGTAFNEFLLRATVHDDEGTHEFLDGVFHIWDILSGQDASFNRTFKVPIKLPEKTDLKISALSDSAIANANCSCSIEVILIPV